MKTEAKINRVRELIKEGYSLKSIHDKLTEEFGTSMSNTDIKNIRYDVDPKPIDDHEYKVLLKTAYNALNAIAIHLEKNDLTPDAFTTILKDHHVNLDRMRIAVYLAKVIDGLQKNPDLAASSIKAISSGLLDAELGWVYSFDELPKTSGLAKKLKKRKIN